MRPLWLDYQRADPERRRPGMALLIFGVAATLLTFADYFAVAAERNEAQARVDELRRVATPQVSVAPSANGAAPGARDGTPVVAPSAERWEALFSSLEAAADETVTLLALQPDDKEVRISGEARDFAASLDYVQRLQSASALANARLTQSEVLAENPRRPVRFALVADWRSAQ